MTQPEQPKAKTVEVTFAHHTTFKGEPVKPLDTAVMDVDEARGFAAAGILTIDTEDQAAILALSEGTAPEPAAPADDSDGRMAAGDDPGRYTVPQVNDYLATADDAEKARVLEAERAGKARSSIDGL